MKKQYLNEVHEKLIEKYEISSLEIEKIIDYYDQLYDEEKKKGLTHDEIVEKNGDSKKIVNSFKGRYNELRTNTGKKIIAITPLVSLIVFILLGTLLNAWHPGWMVFLSVPVVAIIVSAYDTPKQQSITSIAPFLALICFLVIGFVQNVWHPTWLVFLLIPMAGVWGERKKMEPVITLLALSPFLSIITFILFGVYADAWNPAWVVFLSIPMLALVKTENNIRKFFIESSFVIAIAFYLLLGYGVDLWNYGALGFLLPLLISLVLIRIEVDGVIEHHIGMRIVLIFLISIYVILGVLFNTWAFLWVIFLLAPMYSILIYSPRENVLVSMTVFISIIIFYLTGYFLNIWEISWLAFLLIPIVAILEKE